KVNVEVNIKPTGESITLPMDILKLPHYGETGFIINGKNRQIIDKYTKSHGWYVLEPGGEFKTVPHLNLVYEVGKNLYIYHNDYILYLITRRKMSDPAVPLSVFLKTFTGASFKELVMSLGMDNVFVSASF